MARCGFIPDVEIRVIVYDILLACTEGGKSRDIESFLAVFTGP